MTRVLHPRSSVAAAALVVGLVAGAVGLAGCGVPLDQEPRAISQTTIAPSDTVPTTAAPGGASVTVYFLNDGALRAQEYPVDGEVTLGTALGYVLGAPPADTTPTLGTAVPPGTQVRGVQVDDQGLATIDLSGDINDVGGVPQKQAFAQIVFTALGFDEVQRVQFLVDGKPIDAPTDDGNLAVVDADNYDPPLNPR